MWIEIFDAVPRNSIGKKSPSARKVWIEIIKSVLSLFLRNVTFREEGVD